MTSTPDVPLQSRIVDDKSPLCIPFILERLRARPASHSPRPFLIGLNGVQGVGKTTLVRALAAALQERAGLPTLVVSIDDFYLRREDQLALAAAHPANALLQHRGVPGTHDVPLLQSFLDAICAGNGQPVRVPRYDKAAFGGLGDRVLPETQWAEARAPPVQVVILEGWCVGFRALSDAEVERRWRAGDSRTLHKHTLEDLLFVNEQLRRYDAAATDRLDAFVHIDAAELEWVYGWRREQEAALWREKAEGMTEEQVDRFVDAYYPAYELYSDGLREGIFRDRPGAQLALVVGRDRSVQEHFVI